MYGSLVIKPSFLEDQAAVQDDVEGDVVDVLARLLPVVAWHVAKVDSNLLRIRNFEGHHIVGLNVNKVYTITREINNVLSDVFSVFDPLGNDALQLLNV